MINDTKEFLNSTKAITQGLADSYQKLYDEFSAEVDKHTKSGQSIPDVSQKIGDKKITSTEAMRVVNEAVFYGQQLTNLYNSYYAPKLNELKHDMTSAIFALTNAFNTDPEVQAIKTSAEKERQFTIFAYDALQNERTVKKLHESFYFLGKYAENIIFSLDRMQRMIDSLERLQAKELWVDSTAQEQAFKIIEDADDFDDAIKKPIGKTPVANTQEQDTVLIRFEDAF